MLRLPARLMKFAETQAKQVARLKRRSQEEMESLSPEFAERVALTLRQLDAKNWIPVVYHGRRTVEEQAEIVAAGHSSTMDSFHVAETGLGKGANGLYWQVRGEAADIVDARYLWSGPAADLSFAFWKDLGIAAKAQGLRWGGDWKKKDVAHVETTWREFGQDTRHMRV